MGFTCAAARVFAVSAPAARIPSFVEKERSFFCSFSSLKGEQKTLTRVSVGQTQAGIPISHALCTVTLLLAAASRNPS